MILVVIEMHLRIRIWGGATVESVSIKTLTEWIEWAFESIKD